MRASGTPTLSISRFFLQEGDLDLIFLISGVSAPVSDACSPSGGSITSTRVASPSKSSSFRAIETPEELEMTASTGSSGTTRMREGSTWSLKSDEDGSRK